MTRDSGAPMSASNFDTTSTGRPTSDKWVRADAGFRRVFRHQDVRRTTHRENRPSSRID